METGFLNPIHDEEHFSSVFCNQGNVLDDSEHILFGEMIVPEVIDYDNLWPSSDDTGTPGQEDKITQKEEFQKMLHEWQHQLNYMQEPEAIKRVVPLGSTTTQEVSEMFPISVPASSVPTPCVDPSIDELFPLETSSRDIPSTLAMGENGEGTHFQNEKVAAITIKTEPIELDQCKNTQLDSCCVTKKSTETGVLTVISKIKHEEDREKEVDVETVGGEEIPLLMAGDLTSLLEQFEATEKVNAAHEPSSPPRLSSQTIRDALPAEVIDRIKASRENHKKMISLIPAMPNKRVGRAATRMQDAGATLSRNKLLKLVTGGSSGESVQLDHDYCTNGGDSTSSSLRSYCVSDSSEYPSQSSTPDTSFCRMPDFRIRDFGRPSDTGSRKDSGLESGENSDEEVITLANEVRPEIVLKNRRSLKGVNLVNESGVISSGSPVIHKNVPMVSVLKKNIKIEGAQKDSISCAIPVVKECISSGVSDIACTQGAVNIQEGRKKKKLNLEEYRVRREERERFRSQESSRTNSPIPCATPPAQPDSTTSVGSQEGVPKEKPLMLSVEVQTQTCDFIDLTSSKSPMEQEKSRKAIKEKRNDLKHRSYHSRHARSSSSSSSADSDRHRSHRRKRSSRRRSRSRHRRSSASRMWSRSPSHSSSGSHSESSSHSRSRSKSRDRRQKWRSRSPRRHNRYDSSRNYRVDRDRSWQRSRSPVRGPPARNQDFPSQEKVRQVEERRVIYVGRIDEGTSKADLRKRFQQFGPIVDISVHFRERGDNYGFVTFANKADAYNAVEHGNDNPKLPRYDLCFGGRRAFCKQRYADLDGLATNMHCQYGPPAIPPRSNESFDLLLNEVKAQMRKRSSV